MDDRLLHHCIHTGADGVSVLLLGSHALAGVILWAKPEAIVGPLPIRSRRDDHRRGSHIPGPICNYRERWRMDAGGA